jgi:hypothetical protein
LVLLEDVLWGAAIRVGCHVCNLAPEYDDGGAEKMMVDGHEEEKEKSYRTFIFKLK